MGVKPNWGAFARSLGQSALSYAERKRQEQALQEARAYSEGLYDERTSDNREYQKKLTEDAIKQQIDWRNKTNPSVAGKLPQYGSALGVDFGAMAENSPVLQGLNMLESIGGDPRQSFAQQLISQSLGMSSRGAGKGSTQKPHKFESLSDAMLLGGYSDEEAQFVLGDTHDDEIVRETQRLLRLQNPDGSQMLTKDEAFEIATQRVLESIPGSEYYFGGRVYDPRSGKMYNPNVRKPSEGNTHRLGLDWLKKDDPEFRVLDALDEKAKKEAGLPENQPVTLADFVDAHMRPALRRGTVSMKKLEDWAKQAGIPQQAFEKAWNKRAADNQVVEVLAEVMVNGKMQQKVRLANGEIAVRDKPNE